MKNDKEHKAVTCCKDALRLIRLIEKTFLNQTDDQYPGQTLYEQMNALFGCKQGRMTLEQYYSIFNTRADVGRSVGVKYLHPGMQ